MRNHFILLLFLVPFVLLGQDSVDVTFRYKASATALKVFLPGEFNNWGPNASGIISPTAPSAMTLENNIYYKLSGWLLAEEQQPLIQVKRINIKCTSIIIQQELQIRGLAIQSIHKKIPQIITIRISL